MSLASDEGRFVLNRFSADANPDWKRYTLNQTPEYAVTQTNRPGNRVATVGRGNQVCRVAWPSADQDRYGVFTWNTDAAPALASTDIAQLMLNASEQIDDDIARPMKFGEEWRHAAPGKKFPDNTPGIMLRGAELGTLKNHIFYASWCNQLIAHHNDDDPPDMSTTVHDMAGKNLSETYAGKLNSAFWVKLQPGPKERDECKGELALPAIALNFTRSRGEPTGWGFSTFQAKETRRKEKKQRTFTGRSSEAQAANQVLPEFYEEFGSSHNLQAWLSYEKFGPIHPGDPKEDKHQYNINPDEEFCNSGHIWTNAYFFMDKVHDGPVNFIPAPKPVAGRGPLWTDVMILWNNRLQHPWDCGETKIGKWDPVSFSPNFTKEPKKRRPKDPKKKKPPPTDWTPLEREGPSWYPVPKPCVLKQDRSPSEGDQSGDSVYDYTGVAAVDWAQTPRIAHVVATGKLAVTVPNPGKSGVKACPPDYTNPPQQGPPSERPGDATIIPGGEGAPVAPPIQRRVDVVDVLNSWSPGTSQGVLWHAEPELEDYQLRHDYSLTGETLSTSSFGIHNRNILGFGRASSDFGSIVDGFTLGLDGSKDLCITPLNTAGATDTSKTVKFLGPVSAAGTGTFGYWSRSGTTISTANANDSVQIDGNLGIGVAPASAVGLKLNKTFTDAGDKIGLDFALTLDGAVDFGSSLGTRGLVEVDNASAVPDSLVGLSGICTITQCGTLSGLHTAWGVQGKVTFAQSGQTLDRAFGIHGLPAEVSNGTITLNAGVYAVEGGVSGGGAITNNFALDIYGDAVLEKSTSLIRWSTTTTQYDTTNDLAIGRKAGTANTFEITDGAGGNAYGEARRFQGSGVAGAGNVTFCGSGSDINSGVCQLTAVGADSFSMIAGGVEFIRCLESANDQLLILNLTSTSNPPLAPIGDGDTGITFPAADQISTVAGANEAQRWTESGGNISSQIFGDLTVDEYLNVGATSLAVASGDFAAGGIINGLFYDFSAQTLHINNSIGNQSIKLIGGGTSFFEDAVNFNGITTFTNNATFEGDIDLGNDTGDTITFTARADSDFLPTTDQTYDLGSASRTWLSGWLRQTTSYTWMRSGTATDANAQGDFVSGLSGAQRFFFDASAETAYVYDSGGTARIYLAAGTSDGQIYCQGTTTVPAYAAVSNTSSGLGFPTSSSTAIFADGDEAQRWDEDASGSWSEIRKRLEQTSSSTSATTATTIWSQASNDTTSRVEVKIIGSRDDGSGSQTKSTVVLVRNDGGTVTESESAADSVTDGTFLNFTYALSISGTNLQLSITPGDAEATTWRVFVVGYIGA